MFIFVDNIRIHDVNAIVQTDKCTYRLRLLKIVCPYQKIGFQLKQLRAILTADILKHKHSINVKVMKENEE